MKTYHKKGLDVSEVRRYLEPGPTLLVSSSYKGKNNIMTMGWHTVMEFTPSLIGCMITAANYSYHLIEKSGECVLNIPTRDMAKTVVGIGNCSGKDMDKFAHFGLTAQQATEVAAPLIMECYANLECRVYDRRMLRDYNFFVLEVVKAHVAGQPRYPETIHYRGDGLFMVSGKNIRLPSAK